MRDALEATHERFLGRIRELERELDYPAVYAPFPALLADRGVGVAPGGARATARASSEEPGKDPGAASS